MRKFPFTKKPKAKKPGDARQTSVVDELPEPPQGLPTIDLPTAHHYALLRTALQGRAGDLDTVAKKVETEGYPREARVVRMDAAAIREDILPQFERQMELPMATQRDVASGIKSAIQGPIFKHVLLDDESEVDHRAELGEAIGERVAAYVLQVAEKAFAAGVQAREATPEALCVAALSAFYPNGE